jgi:hypothetical protein
MNTKRYLIDDGMRPDEPQKLRIRNDLAAPLDKNGQKIEGPRPKLERSSGLQKKAPLWKKLEGTECIVWFRHGPTS